MSFRSYLLLSLSALTSFLSGCGGDGDSEGNATRNKPEVVITDPLSLQIEEFTGDHTKIVWASYVGSNGDVFANGNVLQLWGIDTRDGKGIRQILEERRNYARPIICPDGKTIVFSSKNMTRSIIDGKDFKSFDPWCYRTDWESGKIEKLSPGYASDVWVDPNTGVSWVYVTDILPTDRSAMRGTKLERFKLYDPDDREVIWDKSEISPDNIQVSRDGKRVSALFPWPHAGVIDTDKGDSWKNQHGCWPSLAPDDSYVAWVFDGAHKNFYMFTDRTKKSWTVPVNGAPGVDGHEMYHPRWSNHVRFFSITGPYIGDTIGQGVGQVNVYLGKFNERLNDVEDWLQITSDAHDDYFPDLWVDHAERVSIIDPTLAPDQGDTEAGAEGKLWPRGGSNRLLFIWEDGNRENKAANERRCSIDARGQARFGPNYEMLADGGFFQADKESGEILDRHGKKEARTTIELLATAFEGDQRGTVFSHGQFQIQQRGDEWIFVAADPKLIALNFGKVTPGKPTHLAATFEKTKGWKAYADGKEVPQTETETTPDMKASQKGMTFGSGWSGSIEGVAIYADTLQLEEIEANHDYFEKTLARREPIPRVKLRGKLIEATAPRSVEELDTYTRALLGYHYEVEEVLEGSFDAKEVIVLHYTTMDQKPLESFPRRPGQSFELLLEPKSRHPELTAEREWNDIFAPDLEEVYFDVATPQP